MRRLKALIANLPLDSAFVRSLSGDAAEWRNTEELLATLIEITDYGNRLFIQAHTDPKRRGRTPPAIEIPRPYKRAQEQKTMTAADLAKLLGRGMN